jgi:hypothetical protein
MDVLEITENEFQGSRNHSKKSNQAVHITGMKRGHIFKAEAAVVDQEDNDIVFLGSARIPPIYKYLHFEQLLSNPFSEESSKST